MTLHRSFDHHFLVFIWGRQASLHQGRLALSAGLSLLQHSGYRLQTPDSRAIGTSSDVSPASQTVAAPRPLVQVAPVASSAWQITAACSPTGAFDWLVPMIGKHCSTVFEFKALKRSSRRMVEPCLDSCRPACSQSIMLSIAREEGHRPGYRPADAVDGSPDFAAASTGLRLLSGQPAPCSQPVPPCILPGELESSLVVEAAQSACCTGLSEAQRVQACSVMMQCKCTHSAHPVNTKSSMSSSALAASSAYF